MARQVGRGVALIVMAVGQLLSTVWLLVFEFTSGSQSLSGTAFVGYLGYSVAAWMICVKHPGRALLIMMAGCAAMLLEVDAAGRQDRQLHA